MLTLGVNDKRVILLTIGGCAQRVRARRSEKALKVIRSFKTLNSALERILSCNHFFIKSASGKVVEF
jgi:hypothetical protein